MLGENVTDLAKGKEGGGVEVNVILSVETLRRLDAICHHWHLTFSEAVEQALWGYTPVDPPSTTGRTAIVYTLPRRS